jgi:hypothetical protein
MNLRDIGITIVMIGLVGGQLFMAMATRAVMQGMRMAGGNADPAQLASQTERAQGYQILGCWVALIGVLVFIIGAFRRARTAT